MEDKTDRHFNSAVLNCHSRLFIIAVLVALDCHCSNITSSNV